MTRNLTILGSTGSIGTQTLDVVREHPELFAVRHLTTNRNLDLLEQQINEFQPESVVVCDPEAFASARDRFGKKTTVMQGSDGCCDVAIKPDIDTVVSAIVGFAGLLPTIEAARHGKRIALANKEAMVVAGDLLNQAVDDGNAELIPVDSEHSAIFQVLAGEQSDSIDRILLTASGGPFRTTPIDQFADITPESALNHPNWDMGAKITVDSATMMNKGLEVIEAHYLFDIPAERIDVVVHPESIVHSLALFRDGSMKAQLSQPDMRMPIRLALSWPDRLKADFRQLDLAETGALTFEAPDTERFPALAHAFYALNRGGSAPAVLNAANELAVESFLEHKIGFTQIADTIDWALNNVSTTDCASLHDILEADKRTRSDVRSFLADLE